jgi:hypothetical protein
MRFTITALSSVVAAAGSVSVGDASRVHNNNNNNNERNNYNKEQTLADLRHEVAASFPSQQERAKIGSVRGKQETAVDEKSSQFSKVKESDVYKKLQNRLMPNKLKNPEKCDLTLDEEDSDNIDLDFGVLGGCSSKDQVCVDPTKIGVAGAKDSFEEDETVVGICVDRASIPDSYWTSENVRDNNHQAHRRRTQEEVSYCDLLCPDGFPEVLAQGYDFQTQVRICNRGRLGGNAAKCNYKDGNGQPSKIECWDVSNVVDMTGAAYQDVDFNVDLNCWDVSSVTSMESMFYGANTFNGKIDAWVTSSVTDMQYMFDNAKNFNQAIGGWNVANVNNMTAMFKDTFDNITLTGFDQDIEKWNVGNVGSMYAMFERSKFNKKINKWKPKKLTDTTYMFDTAYYFNGDLDKFGANLKQVTMMYGMFENAAKFTGKKPLKKWKTDKVTDMSYMFEGAINFQGKGIEKWKVSNVRSFYGMFYSTEKFNPKKMGRWDTKSAIDMTSMFDNATSFKDGSIADWDVSGVRYFGGMFNLAKKFNANLDPWLIKNMENSFGMFYKSGFDSCLATWADKITVGQDSWNNTNMFAQSGCPNKDDPVAGEGPWCQTEKQGCKELTFKDTCGSKNYGGAYSKVNQRCSFPCKDLSAKTKFPDADKSKIKCKNAKCGKQVKFLADKTQIFDNYCPVKCGACFNWGDRS